MKFILGLLLLVSFEVLARGHEPQVALSEVDQAIYQEVIQQCAPGTLRSAVRVGFNFQNFKSGLLSWFAITSFNIQESSARAQSNGLGAHVHQLRHSDGFWLALSHCYGYRYGEVNYGWLVKQIIDLGHLSTEVASTTTGVLVTATGYKYSVELWKKFPLAARFLTAGTVSYNASIVFQGLRPLIFDELSEQDKKEIQFIQSQVFSEPDQAIFEIQKKANERLMALDEELKVEDLNDAQKNLLLEKKQKILASLADLEKLRK